MPVHVMARLGAPHDRERIAVLALRAAVAERRPSTARRARERARVMDAEVVAHLVAHDAKRHRAVDPTRRSREVREAGPATTRRLRKCIDDVLVGGQVHSRCCGLRAGLAGPRRVRAACVRRVDRVPAVYVSRQRELPVRGILEVRVDRVRAVEDDALDACRCPRLRGVVGEVEQEDGHGLRARDGDCRSIRRRL